jgi:amino acid adenylation domain-containing protein
MAMPPPATDTDRLTWLRGCNGITRSYSGAPRVDLAIEEIVAHHGRSPALVANGRTVLFRELDRRANQLAHLLRQRGARPGDLVGIQMERGPELPVAVLATLKAGCAYVPLDPQYPADRLAYMRASARTCLTLVDQPVEDPGWVWTGDPRIAGHDADAPPTGPRGSDDLIYVIFTSGSTGQPKGAGVTHRGFINLMRWFIEDFAITAADRVLLMSSFSFDLTQKNLYAPLMTGGQLHFAPTGPYDPGALGRQIEQAGITLVNCTPSAFYPLAQADDAATRLASLRIAFLGGEPIATRRLAAWQRATGNRCEIANTYGPTECTDICVFHRLAPAEYTSDAVSVPIGRPVPNTAIAILDEAGQPCLAEEVGELCVTGIGVGVGYVNDAALTADKFVANPFPDLPGPTLYRTGDLARWRTDGAIDYLGRIDHQVKIRGFRVELGEIEAVLERHPTVREAVVIARPIPGGEGRRLVAYLVLREGTTGDAPLWRGHVAERLPDYMVPASWVVLPALPLSPNGKVDRRALPEPSEAPTARKITLSHDEAVVAAIWCRVLGTAQLDPEANFFDLGANSLQVAEAHSELARQHPALPITALFQFPTVRSLAKHLRADSTPSTTTDVADRARRQLASRRRPSGRPLP